MGSKTRWWMGWMKNAQWVTTWSIVLATGAMGAAEGEYPPEVPVWVEQDEPPLIELGAAPVGGPPSVADLNEVWMIFEELDEQVRIASAKLDPAALQRKRDIGRVRTMLAETDQQIYLMAARLQRMQERREQLEMDRAGGATAAAPPLPYEPATRLQQQIDQEHTRLETLTRHRSRLNQRLDALYDQHVQTLLEAGLTPASDGTRRVNPLEQMLEEF